MDPNEQIRQIALRLSELEDANAALTRRVFTLETEVARAAGSAPFAGPPPAIALARAAGSAPFAGPPPAIALARAAAPPPLPPQPPPALVHEPGPDPAAEPASQPAAAQAAAEAPPSIERSVGLTWINRIGVLTMVLGVAFFFKFMVDNEWIGPAGRVILGVLAGMLSIWAGDRLWHRDQKTFAQGVQALGTSILYLSFFAAFRFYGLIPQSAAFALMLVTTVMTGALALRYNARATLVLGLLTGYATPFLLSKGEPNDLFFLSYLFLLNTGAALVSRMRGWASVEAFAFAGTWLIHLGWVADRSRTAGRDLAAVFTMLNYAVALPSAHAWLILAAQAISGVALGYGYRGEWREILLPLGLAHFFAGLFIANRKNFAGGSLVAAAGFWLSQAVAEQPRRHEHLTALLTGYTIVFAATLGYAAFRAARQRLHKSDLVAASLCGVIYFTAGGELYEGEYKAYIGLFAVFVAACYLALGYALHRAAPPGKRDTAGPLLAAGLALAFLALAVPIQLTGYRITIGWSIQAAALTFIASKLRDPRVLIGSAILYLLALSRLGSHDAMLYWPPVAGGYALFFNPRFLTFLCVCLSLWFSAWCASKLEEKPVQAAAGLAYVAGHLIMIWALHLEFFAYVDSRADLRSPDSLKTLLSSVVLGGYGLLFISFGFARRAALPRILGLILFGVVIVKLYLYDVWLLDRIYQMIAFIALGGLLLAGSYLYSRFRDKLSTLIRDA